MKALRILRNYLCYCGIEKEDYNAVKKGAYVSNFKVWRILNILMTGVFAAFFTDTMFSNTLAENRIPYLVALIYCVIVTVLFFVINEESIVAQLLIYLSISVLFLFGAVISAKHPEFPATTFIVFMLITPMFMIDKPFFMGIELFAASVIFLIWMYNVKTYDIWVMDLVNVITYGFVGFFVHVVSNSIRIKEFVLTRTINIQKDIDDLTGIKNKGAITREINEYLEDDSKDKGIMFLLDIDHFKKINDTYGHDYGDVIINRLGVFFNDYFKNGEVVGRFGGDEFIFFIKDNDDVGVAVKTAKDIVSGAADSIKLPNEERISVSIGIALYHGLEKNYSEIFKKADMALYELKSTRTAQYKIYV